MNNVVKSPEESDFPKMHLEIVPGNSPRKSEDGSTEIKIAFVNPYSTQEFNEDIQFIMEVGLVAEKESEDASVPPASFVEGGTIGCEHNKRVAARYMDRQGQVVLRIDDNTVPLKVWAGWATGQNPVRLTPDLILEPKLTSTESDSRIEDSANNPADKLPVKPIKQMLPNLQKDVPEELGNLKDERPGHHNTKQKISHTLKHKTENDNRAMNIAESIKRRQLELDLKTDAKQKRRIEHEEEEDSKRDDDNSRAAAAELKRKRQESDARMKSHRSKLEAQLRKNFGSSSDDFDMTRHLVGCGFFVVCIGGFLCFFGKKKEKGRRDL